MSEHLLLISYAFPPYPGIGGRRWAKFAKYLSQLGYIVHVVHAKNPFSEDSLWLGDIDKNNHIKRYELNSAYPKALLVNPKTIFEKLNYRLSLQKVNLLSKGTPYDRSVFWKKKILNRSIALIKEFNIENVIVSSAPFSVAYYALDLKKQFSRLNLMVDLRDPWTWGSSYGFSKLKKKRMVYEKVKENAVMTGYDVIMVPSDEMRDYISLNYNGISNKIHVIPHGFDEDEVVKESKKKSSKVNLMLYGTLYPDLDKVFLELSNVIKSAKGELSLDIYSSGKTYQNLFEMNHLLNNSVNYFPQIKPKELFNKFDSYNYILIIQSDHAKDFITTKIYEIIYTNTPIILISREGKLSQFIVSNGLGIWFSPENLNTLNEKLYSLDHGFSLDRFPIEDFSFRNITLKVANLLK